MEGVKHPSKCFQQAGPPVVSPSATGDQLLGIVFSEGKWCFGLIALVQQPQMSKTLTSAEDLTVTFIVCFCVCVVGVLFLLKARYQVTKQFFCCRVLSGRLLLASRVDLKAFLIIVLFLWLYSDGLSVPQFRLRYRSRYLIYTMLWQW